MKKVNILIIIVLLSCTTTKELVNGNYNDDELTPFQTNSKWGFIDEKGVVHIEPMYDSIGFFYNGIAKVKIDGQCGLIKKDNSYLIKPKFQDIEEFHKNYSEVTYNWKSIYIDSNGKIISDAPLQGAYCWGAIVSNHKGIETKVNGKYELLYERRKLVDGLIKIHYDTTSLAADKIVDYSSDHIQVIKNGKIGITKFDYQNPKKTTINQESLKYDSIVIARYYRGATKYAKVKTGQLWGIINEQGYEIVKPKYRRILTDPIELRNPIAVVNKPIYHNHKKLLVEYDVGKLGYIDTNGKEYFKR